MRETAAELTILGGLMYHSGFNLNLLIQSCVNVIIVMVYNHCVIFRMR